MKIKRGNGSIIFFDNIRGYFEISVFEMPEVDCVCIYTTSTALL